MGSLDVFLVVLVVCGIEVGVDFGLSGGGTGDGGVVFGFFLYARVLMVMLGKRAAAKSQVYHTTKGAPKQTNILFISKESGTEQHSNRAVQRTLSTNNPIADPQKKTLPEKSNAQQDSQE